MEEKRRDLAGASPQAASAEDATPSEPPAPRRRGGGHKRKSTSVNSGGGGGSAPHTTSSKRQAREKPPALPLTPIHMNGPLTRARVQPFSSSFAEVARVESETEAREAAAKARADEMSRAIANWEALEAKIEAEYEAVVSRDANLHVVPVHAGWFSWTKIHPLEERMLPSFFNGKSESRTPEIYMEIRNWIMKMFHANPNEKIELKHLSNLTVGKPDASQEVMEFLDYWGLINYHPFPHQEPAEATNVAADADKDDAGRTDSLMEMLFKFETVQSGTPMVPKMNMTMPAMSSGLFPESVTADELVKSEGPNVEYHCNSCSGDCSRKRYHCQKQADFDLCADCFNNGMFDSNMSPSDFILMEPPEAGGASGGNWTDQETLLLLEAIEIFRDNWGEIAEHVATKTKAQCILHFVQMPIEDTFFKSEDENSSTPKENSVPTSTPTENSAPKADQDIDTALKDVHENTETNGDNNDNQDSSCQMEIAKPDNGGESDKNVEVGENFALKALEEAFEAVGSLPSPGKGLSFAEAGNPVMTLASFLVRLVEPNTANASVRSLLKSLSGNYSSEQLAARHCFPLEDPPDYMKNIANSEEVEAETIEHETQESEVQDAEKQKEAPDSNSIGLNDDDHEGNKESAPEEHDQKTEPVSKDQKPVVSPSTEDADRSDTLKDQNKMSSPQDVQLTSENQPDSTDFPKENALKVDEKVDPAPHTGPQSETVKESGDGGSDGGATQSKDLPKDEDMISLCAKKESGDGASDGGATQSKDLLKDDMISLCDKKGADPSEITTSIAEKEITGDEEAKESGNEPKDDMANKNEDLLENKEQEPKEIKNKDPISNKNNIDANEKLKRAAVTAISAAAVKAKLLADQEEDQILQLSTLLIEKQLYKLETKLAFFNDMENVVTRVRELLEKSKQKLFHERAQIIASRLGVSASSRPPTQALPPNRAAANLPSSAPRPFMGMNSHRPPISRPMTPENPTSSNLMAAAAARGSAPSNADRFSSVGMK